jgi:hypothetical protein
MIKQHLSIQYYLTTTSGKRIWHMTVNIPDKPIVINSTATMITATNNPLESRDDGAKGGLSDGALLGIVVRLVLFLCISGVGPLIWLLLLNGGVSLRMTGAIESPLSGKHRCQLKSARVTVNKRIIP